MMTLHDGLRTDAATTTGPGRREPDSADSTLAHRTWARLFAARYDQRIEDGATITARTPLAAHFLRLTSAPERADMTGALLLLMRDAGLLQGAAGIGTRVPVDADAVRRSADVLREVLARLTDARPVRARGMARLRILLGDGRSPLYRAGAGSLAAELRGVLAAL